MTTRSHHRSFLPDQDHHQAALAINPFSGRSSYCPAPTAATAPPAATRSFAEPIHSPGNGLTRRYPVPPVGLEPTLCGF